MSSLIENLNSQSADIDIYDIRRSQLKIDEFAKIMKNLVFKNTLEGVTDSMMWMITDSIDS